MRAGRPRSRVSNLPPMKLRAAMRYHFWDGNSPRISKTEREPPRMNLHAERLPAMPPSVLAVFRFALRHAAPMTLAVFLIVGVAVLDDYGVSTDEG